MAEMLIVPDIHGEDFYKPVLEVNDKNIVFLGDYLDPYPEKGCTEEHAIENLQEIIEFKKQNTSTVHLLLGNHDCGYIWPYVCESRRSHKYYHDIKVLFEDNFDLFDLVYQTDRYLLSHAGVHKQWYDIIYQFVTNENPSEYSNIGDWLNNWFHCKEYEKEAPLSLYSNFRGLSGYMFGSCVWADVREWALYAKENRELHCYQIFGHTRLRDKPIIEDGYACIDCRRYFVLEDDVLKDLNKEETYNLL
mgnify:CR=1 FL=1